MKVRNEFWDDEDTSDTDKYNSTCSGNVNGWSCRDGNSTTALVCEEVWGDGYEYLRTMRW